jgi:anti-sigma factor (TIGR02949 family)
MTNKLTCAEALRLLAAHIDRELDRENSAELERHLDECRSCYSRAEFERRLKEQLASLHKHNITPDLESRVLSLLRGFGTE